MSISELQAYTKVSKYARYLSDKKRREVWPETVERYADMLANKYPHRTAEIAEAAEYIKTDRVMPSMRGLQFGGRPVEQHNARLYNCTGSYCDRLRFFSEGFYLLLCGSGVGFSVQSRHLQHLPPISARRLSGERLPRKVHKAVDSIEGWGDCANALLSSWFATPVRGFEQYHDCEIEFDLSDIRRKGALLSFGIGKAPGPKPLRAALEKAENVLRRAAKRGERLQSLEAYDLFMHLSDAVVSGGVRRSACICVFDVWDRDMLLAKTGNWMQTEPQRGRSNNSALLLRHEVDYDTFWRLFEQTRQFGEPGFYWADDEDSLPNPCVEVGFYARLALKTNEDAALISKLLATYDGPVIRAGDETLLSGTQMCNLTTIPVKNVTGREDFVKRCQVAARLGTWQAGFAHFPYLGEVSDRIVQRESLLGVSISGVMHHPALLLNPEVLREGAAMVLSSNAEECALTGVTPTARGTVIKPDGNSSAANGCFSGAHGGPFEKGFRVVQANELEAPYAHFKSKNPQACEKSRWSANETDDCIRFCCEYTGVLHSQMTAEQFLDNILVLYENWIVPGKVPSRCTKPWLTNNVSNTVRVKPHEWEGVARKIYDNRHALAGVSLLSDYGDRDYVQAPYTAVYDVGEQEGMYGKTNVELAGHMLRWLGTCDKFIDLWDACSYVLGEWPEGREAGKPERDWKVALNKWAEEFTNGDVRRVTYCLKDAFNWKLWEKLKSSYVAVDYAEMVETNNTVNMQGSVACAGGACEL